MRTAPCHRSLTSSTSIPRVTPSAAASDEISSMVLPFTTANGIPCNARLRDLSTCGDEWQTRRTSCPVGPDPSHDPARLGDTLTTLSYLHGHSSNLDENHYVDQVLHGGVVVLVIR